MVKPVIGIDESVGTIDVSRVEYHRRATDEQHSHEDGYHERDTTCTTASAPYVATPRRSSPALDRLDLFAANAQEVKNRV